MIVSSATLLKAAKHMRDTDIEAVVLKNGVHASVEQLETAARLLQEADPVVITSPSYLAGKEERPGFIEPDQQEDTSHVLVFTLGILPSTNYCIARDGEILDEAAT